MGIFAWIPLWAEVPTEVIGSSCMATATNTELSIAQIIPDTEAEGPGRRFAVWVQGCPMRCQECCNPEMLRFEGGERVRVSDLVARALEASRGDPRIESVPIERTRDEQRQGGQQGAHADHPTDCTRAPATARPSTSARSARGDCAMCSNPAKAVGRAQRNRRLLNGIRRA